LLDELPDILKCTTAELPVVFYDDITRPLAIGIDVELIARFPQADPNRLCEWLHWWTKSVRYLVQMARGGTRHGLDGAREREITPNQIEHANANSGGRQRSHRYRHRRRHRRHRRQDRRFLCDKSSRHQHQPPARRSSVCGKPKPSLAPMRLLRKARR
jgi:sRNA-binding protein